MVDEVESITDPFGSVRDAREQAANDVMREFLLAATAPAQVFRQRADGYALIVPSVRGARRLTVPGADEADFLFHGEPRTSGAELADFIDHAIADSGVDHLRLPALNRLQAAHLKNHLSTKRPDWQWDVALAAISPLVISSFKRTSILRTALKRADTLGISLELERTYDPLEFASTHTSQWGPESRSATFFRMIERLFQTGCAEILTARNDAGALLAAHVDILGDSTRHFYYSVCHPTEGSGCGTALLGLSWNRFRHATEERVYSFGRGTERYKFQYANAYRKLYELRGFRVPVEDVPDGADVD